MKRDAITPDYLQDAVGRAFKVEKRYRAQITAICEETGLNVSTVINACLGYGLRHLQVKPVLQMGLVFDDQPDTTVRQ